MPQFTDKHYADFGGLDTTTNLLKMDPKTQRRGSKNFRYNNDDQLTQRYGFQHITELSSAFKFGLAEYKYRDLNTGESKVEILGVGSDGFLHRLRNTRLKIVRSSGSVVYYSVFYNGDDWTFALYGSAMDVIYSTHYDNTYTLSQLVTYVNLSAITGIALSIVDENDSVVTCAIPAYLMNTVIVKEFSTAVTNTEYNALYYDELVQCPSSSALFPEVLDSAITSLPDFEGLTSTNLNNCIYLTCGGFPIKYDGKSAYRAGVPAVLPQIGSNPLNASGISAAQATTTLEVVFTISPGSATFGATYTNNGVTFIVSATVVGATSILMLGAGGPTASGTLTKASGAGDATLTFSAVDRGLTAGSYAYKFKFGHIDSNGAENLGDYGVSNYFGTNGYIQSLPSGAGHNSITLTYYGFVNDSRFPVYACKVNGAQNIATAGGTINVDSGHNIKVGMLVQIPISNAPTGFNGYSYIISKVTAVAATTITLASGRTSGIYPFVTGSTTLIVDNQILQAGYRETYFDNTITDIQTSARQWQPQTIVGSFLRVYRTKVGQTTGPFYKMRDLPLPLGAMGSTSFTDIISDANLIEEFDDSEGGPLPRACRYIGQWQKQLVQGGRPYDTTLKDDYYPSYYAAVNLVNNWSTNSTEDRFYINEETALCDFQSVYWADPLNAEAFPTSGLNEEDFQGKHADQIKGFGENKEALFVMKDRTAGMLTGTLATNDIQKEILEIDAGCSSHNSIQEVNGSLVWLDGVAGFWACVAGRLPEYFGWKIQDDFRKNNQKANSQKLLPGRAKSVVNRIDSQYICYIPAGYVSDVATGDPSSYSIMFVFDFSATEDGKRNCWYQWQDVSPNAGLLYTSTDELIFSENRAASYRLWKQKRTATKYDMADHNAAIEFNAKNAWLNYGTPTIDKDFVNSWINSVEGGFTLTVQQYYNYMDTAASSYNVTMPTGTSKVSVKKSANLNVPKLSALSLGFYHNTKNELVTIDGWEVVLAQDYDPGEPKI